MSRAPGFFGGNQCLSSCIAACTKQDVVGPNSDESQCRLLVHWVGIGNKMLKEI